MRDFDSVSPLKVLDASSRKKLGPGNLGVLVAQAGMGKTACLIQIALEKLLHDEKLVHVSLEEGPDKVTSYYDVIYHDLLKVLGVRDEPGMRSLVEGNRMILAYLNQSFDLKRLRTSLRNLAENVKFRPDTLIVDGLEFDRTERNVFEGLKEIADEFRLEMWLSALSHRHVNVADDRGIPYPCNQVDDLFSLIIQLQPDASGIFLRLLKDHDNPHIPDNRIKLDPKTFFAIAQSS